MWLARITSESPVPVHSVMQKVSCGIDAYKDPDEHSEMLRHLRCFMGLITTMEMSINTWRYIANSQWKRFTQVLDCFNA